jgi:hypothetical protein
MILWHCARRAFSGVAAAFLLTCGGLLDEAGAKPIKMQFQDVKIDYKADKAGTMATSIDLVVQNADSGKALSKFQIQVSAPGFTVGYSDGSWKLTGNVADGATVTIKIASVGAYKGNISVQSAIFLNGAVPVAQGTVSGGALKGDPIYTIDNDLATSPDLTIEDLTFYENHAPVDLATLDPSIPLGLGGIPEGDVALDGVGASDDFTLPPTADYPGYFLAQGEVFQQGGTTTPVAWFVDGYVAIPEPPTALLVLPPLLLAMWASRRLPNALAPRG